MRGARTAVSTGVGEVEGCVNWDLLGAKMGNAKMLAVILGPFLRKVRHLVL